MKIKKIILNKKAFGILMLLIGFFITVSFMQINPKKNNPKIDGYVPNEETAIKIAEAIWLPIYGNDIYKYRPFKADLINNKIWKVYGTVHTEKGGSPIAEIQKSDCKIISVIHEK